MVEGEVGCGLAKGGGVEEEGQEVEVEEGAFHGMGSVPSPSAFFLFQKR